MANAIEQSVLRRMVAPPRPPLQADGGAVDRVVTVEFPRSADQLLGLTVEVQSIRQAVLEKDDVLAVLTPFDLVYLLKGAGRAGIALLDKDLLAALVEVQTTGRVTPAPAGDRPPTRTDAIVVSDMVDRWIADVRDGMTAGTGFCRAISGTTREDRTVDPRAAALLLDPIRYHSLRVEMSIAGGAKAGAFQILVPAPDQETAEDGTEGDLALALRPHLGEVRTRMRAVLGQVSIPLAEVLDLAPDRVLPLVADDIRQVTLVRDGGMPIGHARLGQINGTWAVRPFGAGGNFTSASVPSDPGFVDKGTSSALLAAAQGAGPRKTPVSEAGDDRNAAPPDAPDPSAVDDPPSLPGGDGS